MKFAEKLTALLTLTGTKNAQLADALHVGRPYISRMKTGDRKLPGNSEIVRNMAAYFAGCCKDAYHINALREFTSDPRLNAGTDEAVLTEVIFDYLSGTTIEASGSAGHFFSSFELYSTDGDTVETEERRDVLNNPDRISTYYGNEGKRRALKDMFTFVDSLNSPVTVYMFTDESYEWLTEDIGFSRWLNAKIQEQAAKGICYERIQPPFSNVEFTFAAIERWLPGYMAGAVQQLYYPWPRDQLHRRSIFVVPEHVALYCDSVFGEQEALLTLLTCDAGLVDVCSQKYEAIRKRCRPAIRTFSADSEHIFTAAEEIAAIENTGVYKTDSLSINTLPPSICERIQSVGTPFALRIYESYELRAKSRMRVLSEHHITDIMYLPPLARILAGKEPIPGTQSMPSGTLYYTPQEYKAHLERILWYLDVFPNYHAVFTDDPAFNNVIVFAKGDSRAMLVKTASPFTVFDVTESSVALAFCDYLKRIAEEKMTSGARQTTIELLNDELRRLEKAMR